MTVGVHFYNYQHSLSIFGHKYPKITFLNNCNFKSKSIQYIAYEVFDTIHRIPQIILNTLPTNRRRKKLNPLIYKVVYLLKVTWLALLLTVSSQLLSLSLTSAQTTCFLCCEIRGPINLITKWRTFKGSDIFIKTKPDECVHVNLMRLLIWRVNMATNGCCDLS